MTTSGVPREPERAEADAIGGRARHGERGPAAGQQDLVHRDRAGEAERARDAGHVARGRDHVHVAELVETAARSASSAEPTPSSLVSRMRMTSGRIES